VAARLMRKPLGRFGQSSLCRIALSVTFPSISSLYIYKASTKVECARLIQGTTGTELAGRHRDSWLTIGKTYIVLEVYVACGEEVLFRCIADNGTPALFHARSFETKGSRLPSSWIGRVDTNGTFQLTPARWARPGFWEDYFRDLPEALYDFTEEVAKMMAELVAE
jgi:hypothetical protein